jgi:hypothetical protein
MKITQALANEQLQGKNYAAWPSGTGGILIWETTQNM